MSFIKQLISDLRGGTPKSCDWCGDKVEQEDLIPVSGGEWHA